MAKSSRSKWKKAHKQLRAKAEAQNVSTRVRSLNGKLKLLAKGRLGPVPFQNRERRFHFHNPESPPAAVIPFVRRGRKAKERSEALAAARAAAPVETIDFSKPLILSRPTTTFHGKSDPMAPHPMTVNKEEIDARAPIAGHALTKADMEWLEAQKAEADAALDRAAQDINRSNTNEVEAEDEEDEDDVISTASDDGEVEAGDKVVATAKRGAGARGKGSEADVGDISAYVFDNDSANEPVELVLGVNDATSETTDAARRALAMYAGPNARIGILNGSNRSAKAPAAAKKAEQAPAKIKSMQQQQPRFAKNQRGNAAPANKKSFLAAGSAKMKHESPSRRIVASGGKAAAGKTGSAQAKKAGKT